MSTYNGWANYETWNVALWIDNEQGTYEEARDMARRARSVGDLARSVADLPAFHRRTQKYKPKRKGA